MERCPVSWGGVWFTVPVIAVPTGIRYGAETQGDRGLLTVLNSCAVGVSVW